MKKIFITALVTFVLTGIVAYFIIDKKDTEAAQKDRMYNALLDSTKTIKTDTSIIVQKLVPEADLKDIINSAVFDKLSERDKEWYKQLEKVNGLLFAANQRIQAMDSVINKKGNYDQTATITDSTVNFKVGATIHDVYKTANLNLESSVTFNKDAPYWSHKYTYTLGIDYKLIRQKDKSLLLKTEFSDPNITILDNKNYYKISKHDRMNGWERFWYRYGVPIGIIGGVILGRSIIH